MAVEWYVAIDGCQKGPFSTPELRRWIREGKVVRHTLVKEGPNGPWTALRDVRVPCAGTVWQALLNLIGFGAVLAIGVELFLFMFSHPATQPYAIWGSILYFLAMLCFGPRWAGKRPAK